MLIVGGVLIVLVIVLKVRKDVIFTDEVIKVLKCVCEEGLDEASGSFGNGPKSQE